MFKEKPSIEKTNKDFEKKLSSVIEFVKGAYNESDKPKEQIEKFNEHNKTIMEYTLELAKKEKLDQEDLEALKLAAALHDVAKLGTILTPMPLVKHGFKGSEVAREKLTKMGFDDEIINRVANAIERHMGPIPGFMVSEAKRWEKETREKIEFPRPQNDIDKLLYDADMLALIDRQGIEKILTIRRNIEVFQKEDKETAQREGIAQEEAAKKSALKSAEEAANSLFTESAKKKAHQLLEEAREYLEI